jgi:alkanesulfonate monooxygenase SsuD/methylene tetrahydromethanopterin reductase-like flavin-dependent oxidoreductase (luciferase family)
VLLTAIPDPNVSEDTLPEALRGRMVVGSPEQIAATVQSKVVDAGIDGVIMNMPPYVPGSIAAVGAALRPVVGR